MKCSEKIDCDKDNGIVLSQHPAVIVTVEISGVSKDLKAGNVLSLDDTAKWTALGASGKAFGVIVEDIKAVASGEQSYASVLLHGCVNKDRIVANGKPIEAKTFVELMTQGIYPVQSFNE